MKKIILAFLLFMIGMSAVSSAFAQNNEKLESIKNRISAATESGTIGGEKRSIEVLKKRVTSMIEKRIALLKRLVARVDGNSKLDESSKLEIKKEIDTVVTRLTGLKTEVNSAADVASVQAIHKKVLDEKVYSIVMQKMQLVHLINKLTRTIVQLETVGKKLEVLIASSEKEGKDVATLKVNLSELNIQLTTLKTTLSGIKSKVVSATNDDYQRVFTQARADLAKVRAGFGQIRIVIATIKSGLRSFGKPALDVTSTPTSTTSPTLIPTTSL